MTPAALRGAAILLDFIGKTETGRTGTAAYRTIYGHREGTLPKPVTDFTIDELLAAQVRWGKNWGSSAAGKFQIIRKTLGGLVKALGLSGSAKFGVKTQDMLGLQLLKGRDFERFAEGRISVEAFALQLAKEWASMPVLADTQGASRKVKAGQSFYAGDGLNKALVTPAELRSVLADVLNAVTAPVETPPIPDLPAPAEPAEVPIEEHEEGIAPAVPAKPRWLHIALIVGAAALVFGVVWLFGQAPAGEPSMLGGAPVPRPRPFGLLGSGESLWTDIALQIALSFAMPLVSAAATAAVGWIVYWWQRVLKADFDAKSAEALHSALERGMLAAIDALGARTGKRNLLNFAADYAATNNPGAVRHFKLAHEDLERLAVPHLVSGKGAAR